jgi:hypothetical protein
MKPFTKIAAVFFTLGALIHALRFYYGWPIQVGDHLVPLKASIAFVVIGVVMAWGLWKESR